MDDELDDFTPWTPDGAERVRAAASALIEALTAHAEAVASATSDADIVQVFEANERLLPLAVDYSDAQFDYTGNFGPFGALHALDDDEVDDEDDESRVAADDGPDTHGPATGITVLERRDYAVLDEDAVIEAGRRAYRELWPDDDAAGRAVRRPAPRPGGLPARARPGLARARRCRGPAPAGRLRRRDPARRPARRGPRALARGPVRRGRASCIHSQRDGY